MMIMRSLLESRLTGQLSTNLQYNLYFSQDITFSGYSWMCPAIMPHADTTAVWLVTFQCSPTQHSALPYAGHHMYLSVYWLFFSSGPFILSIFATLQCLDSCYCTIMISATCFSSHHQVCTLWQCSQTQLLDVILE